MTASPRDRRRGGSAAAARSSPAPARAGRSTPGCPASSPFVLPAPCGSSSRSGTSATRRSATPCRRSSRPSSGFALVDRLGDRRRRWPWTGSPWSGAPSSRCSSASQTIPIVAIAPLFVLWFGFGLLPKVLVVVLVTFFPITSRCSTGSPRRAAEATDLLRSFGATRRPGVPQAPLADGAARVLHRAADLGDLRGHRRGVRRVRRRARGPGDLDAARRSARSGLTSCSRRSC